MLRNYEGLFILNVQGKEEGSKELIEKLEKDIQAAGGKVQKVERMDKRPFARVAQKLDAGYYVNIRFEMSPEDLATFRNKLKLDADVFRATFTKATEISARQPREEVEA